MAKARGTGAKKGIARVKKARAKAARKPARAPTSSAKRRAPAATSRAAAAAKPALSARRAQKPRTAPAIKPASPARRARKPRVAPAIKPARSRPAQRFVVSHHHEDDFATNGLRAYAQYRDLGIAAASHGMVQAHVVRLIGPCDPREVSKLHFHDVEFQLVYVLKGWVKAEFEGKGEVLMRTGSCWTQPPRIKHMILDYSNDCELLEVILPAEFETVELSG